MTDAEIVRWVIDRFEGHAFTDDPVDTGGATRFGITQRTLQYYRRKVSGDPALVVTAADVAALGIDEAVACGVAVFMAEPGIGALADWRIRLVTFDYGFHSGPARAIRALQDAAKALSLVALPLLATDGVLGPATRGLVDGFAGNAATLLAVAVDTARQEFMQGLAEQQASQRAFLLGWWKRTTALLRIVTDIREV